MRRPSRSNPQGFSLIELMVATLFTMLLMAGLATVFRASLGSFVTNADTLSSARRNRMTIDMIFDDFNQVGMKPTSLTSYPTDVASANPAFWINPNVPYGGTDVPAAQAKADNVYLYFDELLPFEGRLGLDLSGTSALVGQSIQTQSVVVNFNNSQEADQVVTEFAADPVNHVQVIPRAALSSAVSLTGMSRTGSTTITFTPDTSGTGFSAQAASPNSNTPRAGSPVFIAKPSRYVRYSIQSRGLDPENPANGIPCLIRDEILYPGSAVASFAAPLSSSIVAENVTGFKVMLSPDSGVTWYNDPADAAHCASTWTGLTGALNANPNISGRPGSYNQINDSKFWLREIPLTVRVDITTRTARPRGEYIGTKSSTLLNSTALPIPYKTQTRSLVLIPRHFGLSYPSQN